MSFENIYNETRRFRCEIIHKMLKYFKVTKFFLGMQCQSWLFLLYFSDTSNVTDNTAKNYTSSCYKETESSRVHSLMFAVIGLTSVSLIIYMVYVYTRVLGKRQTNTSAFVGWKYVIQSTECLIICLWILLNGKVMLFNHILFTF